ncbi:MAG: hypothetical protein AAGB04_11285 [Pseudomonadota bacterium]
MLDGFSDIFPAWIRMHQRAVEDKVHEAGQEPNKANRDPSAVRLRLVAKEDLIRSGSSKPTAS